MQAESLAEQCVAEFPGLKGVVTAQKVLDQAAAFRKANGLSAPALPMSVPVVAKPVAKGAPDSDDSSDDSSGSDTDDAPAPQKPAAKSPVAPPTKPTPAAAGKEMSEDDERPSQKTGSQKRKVTFQAAVESSDDDDDDDDGDSDSDEDERRAKKASRGANGPYKPPAKVAK
jgi:hypothetical protein